MYQHFWEICLYVTGDVTSIDVGGTHDGPNVNV